MAKDPAFLFYPNDYLGGTMGMTFEEKGAYMDLLMMQFNRGHMSGHMIGQTVGQLWDKLQDKFQKDDKGLWFNERLEIEQNKRKAFTNSRRNNLKGVNQYSKNEGHTTNRMENVNENRNINVVSFEKSEKLLPTIEEFLIYAEEITGVAFYRLKPALVLKFESWKVNDWHTGGKKSRKIKNWKNTLANTIPYLKPTDDNTPVMLADKMKQDAGIQ